MADYDASIIQTFADRLYRRATSIIASYTLMAFLLGCVSGAALGVVAGGVEVALIMGLVFGFVAAIFGYFVGVDRAFALKLQAQIALCQLQIEANTRRAR